MKHKKKCCTRVEDEHTRIVSILWEEECRPLDVDGEMKFRCTRSKFVDCFSQHIFQRFDRQHSEQTCERLHKILEQKIPIVEMNENLDVCSYYSNKPTRHCIIISE